MDRLHLQIESVVRENVHNKSKYSYITQTLAQFHTY